MPKTNASIEGIISKKLGSKRLFYVCRDLERAWPIMKSEPAFIISNHTPSAARLAGHHPRVTLIKTKTILDTSALLNHAKTKKIIRPYDYIIVFKNTHQLEKICAINKWHLLNPPSDLSKTVEEKISQIRWLGQLNKLLPAHHVVTGNELIWKGRPFILQFNHAHTGSGTMLINSKKQLVEIKSKFPKREIKISKYIIGPFFTNNNTVWGKKILTGNISYQITGLAPFTDNRFATIGNDWELPNKILTPAATKQFLRIARQAGKKLVRCGWRGLYGIDAVMDIKTKRVYLIEINCRQPASASYESELQKRLGQSTGISIFTAHLAALLNIKYNNYKLIKIKTGAQIIWRHQLNETWAKINPRAKAFNDSLSKFTAQTGKQAIAYSNDKPDSDLIRFQTKHGIMLKHKQLKKSGYRIIDFIETIKHGQKWDSRRAGILIIKNDKLLTMARNKYGKKYFTIPGGTMEAGENIRQTAVRETKEETGLNAKIDEYIKPIHLKKPREEFYFFAKNIKGQAKLGGPEKQYSNAENSYKLVWVRLNDLKKINLKPTILKKIIINKYHKTTR